MPGKWVEPFYQFKLPSREIVVNVTRSCPGFEVPVPSLDDVAAELASKNMLRVLDFGAGKLRNALFLLKHRAHFTVWAVEYEQCFATPLGVARLKKAMEFHRFFFLKYPSPFLTSKFEVDAVLLINVANVVPDDDDRRLMIKECARRLRRGGYLLWMSQYGEPNYKPGVTRRLKVADGWCYSLNKEYQTFYKEFIIPEIKDYFPSSQFHEVKKVSAPHHRAFIFEKI